MEIKIGEIVLEEEIEIGAIEMDIQKVYPELEDIEITPSGVEQNFKSEKYGYDNVKVKAVESDTLDIVPSEEKQQHIGLYGVVNVDKIPSEYIKPEGTLEITDNGEYNVKTYEKANVNIEKKEDLSTELTEQDNLITTQGTTIEDIVELLESKSVDVEGTLDITENGEYNVKNYEKANVNVPEKFYNAFWDAYQQKGERTNYSTAFRCETGSKAENYKAYDYWNADTFKPKYDIKPVSGTQMFHTFNIGGTELDLDAHLKECGVVLDMSECTICTYMFANCNVTVIPELNFSEKMAAGGIAQLFYNAQTIKTIKKINVYKNFTYNSMFYGCSGLENITFDGEIGKSLNVPSKVLSMESVQNIIDCLVDLTGETAQTLTFVAEVKAKLTEEQIASITSKNWNLA